MSVLSRRNEETYGIPAILRIIPAKVSEGTGLQRVASCLPEKSYGHVILIVTLKKMNCAFKKPLQKKKKKDSYQGHLHPICSSLKSALL